MSIPLEEIEQDIRKKERDLVREEKKVFLECEKEWVFWLLTMASGWFGSYTFLLRGGVFCNAQTANVVLFGLAIGTKDWSRAAYLLLPIGAYFLGTFLSEILGNDVKKFHFLRWDTVLIGFEVLVILVMGFIPASAPDQICQVALNFICSMQFNTFRQAEGTPAATTFVTNHIRQVGSAAGKLVQNPKNAKAKARLQLHGSLILFFLLGAILSAFFGTYFGTYSIWGSGIILLIVFLWLAYADTHSEKGMLEQIPHGH